MAVKSNLFLDFFNKAYFAQSLKLIEAKYKLDLLEQKIIEQDLLQHKILFIELDDDDDFPSELNGSTELAR